MFTHHSPRYWTGLTFSGWLGSRCFSIVEIWQNTFCAYYLTIALSWAQWELRGNKAWSNFLPQTTTRNVLKMLSNLIVRLEGWPLSTTCEPAFCMEDTLEFFFGEIKTCKKGVHGTASTANSIAAAQLLHLRRAGSVPKAWRVDWHAVPAWARKYSSNEKDWKS